MRERRRSLRLRLLAAFLLVGALAVASFAVLILWATSGDLNDFVRRQQQTTVHDAAGALADAYREAGTWAAADLRPAQAVAAAAGATLLVRDLGGGVVEQPGVPPGLWETTIRTQTPAGPTRTAPIVVAGERVGTASLRFPTTGLPPPEQRLRSALVRTAAVGIGVAAAVAIGVGALVSARVMRPLRRLAAAVERVGRGDRSARADLSAPGELGALGEAVDRMAAGLEQEERLRRELVADVSHELRTPITILTAECERLVDGSVEPAPERLASLYDEALRLGRAVEDVEALARSGAAAVDVERRPTRLDEVVGRVAETLRPQFETAELGLELRLEPAVVDGDPDRLAQVARNLLSNALKFTPGGGRVSVAVELSDGEARFTVADTGPGIAAEELPHVFERFWRGRDARRVSGSGVGLAVVDELVRAHGGRIAATSDGRHGSTFTVVLPQAGSASSRLRPPFIRSPHAAV